MKDNHDISHKLMTPLPPGARRRVVQDWLKETEGQEMVKLLNAAIDQNVRFVPKVSFMLQHLDWIENVPTLTVLGGYPNSDPLTQSVLASIPHYPHFGAGYKPDPLTRHITDGLNQTMLDRDPACYYSVTKMLAQNVLYLPYSYSSVIKNQELTPAQTRLAAMLNHNPYWQRLNERLLEQTLSVSQQQPPLLALTTGEETDEFNDLLDRFAVFSANDPQFTLLKGEPHWAEALVVDEINLYLVSQGKPVLDW